MKHTLSLTGDALFLEGEAEKDTVSIKAIPRGSTWTKTFDREVFLQSAWNGSLEIHQKRDSGELVSSIPDLRDYLIYYPSLLRIFSSSVTGKGVCLQSLHQLRSDAAGKPKALSAESTARIMASLITSAARVPTRS